MPATLITDGNGPFGGASAPMLRLDSQNGYSGQRDYRVDTTNEPKAFSMCPPLGSAWDADTPSCIVMGYEYKYVAKNDGADGTGAIGIVRVYYGSPKGRILPPPSLGQKFTILSPRDETATKYNDIRLFNGAPLPDKCKRPMNDGQGFGVKIGVTSAKVYVYFPLSQAIDFARLVRLQNEKAVNNAALALPPMLGTTTFFNMGIGQVQYEGFNHDVKNGFLEIIHDLSLAPNFYGYWQLPDKNGDPTSETVENWLYQFDNLGGLW